MKYLNMQSLHKKEQVKNIAALFEKRTVSTCQGKGCYFILWCDHIQFAHVLENNLPFRLMQKYHLNSVSHMFKRFKSRWALSGKKFSLVVMVHLTSFEWVSEVPGQKLNSGEREIPINHIQHLTPRKQRKTVMLNVGNKCNT